jgi:hypothetical protein
MSTSRLRKSKQDKRLFIKERYSAEAETCLVATGLFSGERS